MEYLMSSSIEKKIEQYKKEQLVYSGEGLRSLLVPRISTGIFVLDLLTGGGMPEGRITEFYGAKSSTKSTTAMRVAGNYLHKYPKKKVLYADFEGTFDEPWARRFVDDLSRFNLLIPDYGEQGVDVIKDFAADPNTGLIIVDSVAMMVPFKEADGGATDQTPGLQAKLVNRLFRLLFPFIISRRRIKNYLSILIINQLRANIGKFGFQSPTIKPGGMMQDFLYSLDIQFYTIRQIESMGIPAKSVHQFTVQKNKLGLQKRSGEYTMRLLSLDNDFKAGSIDEAQTIFNYARKAGVINLEGKTWKVGNISYNKIEDVVASLNDPVLAEPIKQETLKRCVIDVLLTSGKGDTNGS